MSHAETNLDSYTAKAEELGNKLTPQEKITGFKEIIDSVQTAMLTTRSADGQLHSRAMNPSKRTTDTQLNLVFVANNASHKFEEIQNDSHVNVSFYDPSTSNWASISGKARLLRDKDEIKKHWTAPTAAWFGDLKDGVHKGDENDPRISLIEVIPDEIRYWYVTRGKIGRAMEVGVGAVTGKVASPGELRTITKQEIQLAQGLN
ncbi:hypothetical protein DFP72DRAFT_986845 [Ephemerocybe angulata]|uniref:General stress protein FMN-binding split barrel domain-containing protein n=1 Tax=Ephemerocybe angulata TaxID=980116 RepID=A0A8H6IEP5_9AGAR|nr:hypothetical protein DFP72DRAFT_986845 [Tulosesus angulatus]